MHENELEITDATVQHLINIQFPEFSLLPIVQIISYGTDHKLFRLGDNYIIRLPKIEWASDSTIHEFMAVPKIAYKISTSISEPLYLGIPDKNYPWNWLILKWNEGINPTFEKNNEYSSLAIEISSFINGCVTITV